MTNPIALAKAILCRETLCFRGQRSDSTEWEYVVKFTWLSDKGQGKERMLLKLTKVRGVIGIAEWFHYEQVAIDGSLENIANLQKGMKFGALWRLSNKISWVGNGTEPS
jgi:hypothetical protein